jgi:hypothetical protein
MVVAWVVVLVVGAVVVAWVVVLVVGAVVSEGWLVVASAPPEQAAAARARASRTRRGARRIPRG